MVLCELPFGCLRIMPLVRVYTHKEASDRHSDRWILEYVRDRVRIRDILAGRVRVTGFSVSSHLHMVIDLVYTLFDKEGENWTQALACSDGETHGENIVQCHMHSQTEQ